MSEPIIRDALLLKCKSAIEELHREVDRLGSENRELCLQREGNDQHQKRLQERLETQERETQRL
jgi:hypothetical protein